MSITRFKETVWLTEMYNLYFCFLFFSLLHVMYGDPWFLCGVLGIGITWNNQGLRCRCYTQRETTHRLSAYLVLLEFMNNIIFSLLPHCDLLTHSSVWCQKVMKVLALFYSLLTFESHSRCTSNCNFKRSMNIWFLIIRPYQSHWWVIWVSEAQRLRQTPTVDRYRLAFVRSVTLHFSPYHAPERQRCCFWERWETRPWLAVSLSSG